MYLEELAASIRAHIPANRLPEGNADELLRIYAVLLRAKGRSASASDVHDAWAAWMADRDENHESLVPYMELSQDVREQDLVFVAAIRAAFDEMGYAEQSRPAFSEILFPSGLPSGEEATRQMFDLYKMMVQSSEGLVSRRQGVNTFFLTMNGALLTATGLIVQSAGGLRLGAVAVSVLALAGVLLCAAWRSLITSFGQLNRGKFQVINAMERHFAAAIYSAEWEALGRGEDPKVYRSFTSREIWVPISLLVLHILTAIGAILVAAGWVAITRH
jgi:hypothetical protein